MLLSETLLDVEIYEFGHHRSEISQTMNLKKFISRALNFHSFDSFSSLIQLSHTILSHNTLIKLFHQTLSPNLLSNPFIDVAAIEKRQNDLRVQVISSNGSGPSDYEIVKCWCSVLGQ